METMYFILGMFTMVALAFVCVIVVGLLKIRKQEKQINDLKETVNYERNSLDRHLQDIFRSREDFERNVWDSIRNNMNDLDKQFDLIKKESNSYTDSRIDKLIDTYFEFKNINKSNKELIKG